MGIYSKVTSKLPRLPAENEEDPKWQDKVDDVKNQIRSMETHTPESLTKLYRMTRFGQGPELTTAEQTSLLKRLGQDGIKELLSQASLMKEAVQQLLIQSQLDDEVGWGTHGAKDNALRTADGATLRIDAEPSPKVLNKEEFRLWCIEQGLAHAMHLHSGTAASIVKQRLLAGHEDPPGVQSYTRYKVVFTKPGAKSDG